MNYLINEEIPFKNILLIYNDGRKENISITNALDIANELNLDLVCFSNNNENPVCKLIDFKKFKFEQEKKSKENKKKQTNINSSEIQISYTIMKHDMETKANICKRILEKKKSNIKIVMRLSGREMNFLDFAKIKFEEFLKMCDSFANIKKPLVINGNEIQAILENK